MDRSMERLMDGSTDRLIGMLHHYSGGYVIVRDATSVARYSDVFVFFARMLEC